MNVVLCCPGPSLANLNELPPCDLSIAVNRAAIRFACDVWAASDYPTIKKTHEQVLGSPRLLTIRQTWLDVQRFPKVAAMQSTVIEEVQGVTVPTWAFYTATAALGYAWSLGAKRVDVYGADQTDAPDWDNHLQPGTDRSESRWERERTIWREIVKASGMNVVRH